MAFPTSPSNNQLYKIGNRAWVYDSTLAVWDQVADNDTDASNLSGTLARTRITFPAGHILQTKHFPYTSHMSIPNGSSSAVSIPFTGSTSYNDYGCPITLNNTSNKVFVALTIYSGNINQGANHQYRLMYNTSVGGTWTNSVVNGAANYWALIEHDTYSGIQHQTLCHTVNDIFVPSSYDSGTTVWVKNHVWHNASATGYINRSGNGNNYVRGTSMILMEINV